MKIVLSIVSAISVLAAILLFTQGTPEAAGACLGGAILAGTGYGILDRLDTIAAHLKPAKPTLSPEAAGMASATRSPAEEMLQQYQKK